MKDSLVIDGREVVFRCVMDRNKYNLSELNAALEDMPDEYAIVYDDNANADIIIYAKYKDKWVVNPSSTRFLVRELLDMAKININ